MSLNTQIDRQQVSNKRDNRAFAFYRCQILCLTLSVLNSGQALANDTAFAGHGSTIIPVKNHEIEMVEEHVVINGVPIDGSVRMWDVYCQFIFKNTTQEKIQLKMGFPFPLIDGGDSTYIPGKGRSRTGIYDFEVFVRGKFMNEIKSENLDKSKLKYANAYTWFVTFDPGEKIEVINRYTTSISYEAGGVRWVDYILVTGSNWKGGRIGRSLLEVRPNALIASCGDDDEHQTTPRGMKVTGRGKSVRMIWDLKNFRPQNNLHLCFMSDRSYFGQLIGEGVHDRDTLYQLRLKRNSIYARHGYIFKDAKLRSYFNKQWWYEPNSKFKTSQLTKEELDFINLVKSMENKKKRP